MDRCVSPLLTLDRDLAEGAGVASGARGEAHVLARIVRGHVVQDERAGAVGVLDDDVVRVCLHGASICVKPYRAFNPRVEVPGPLNTVAFVDHPPLYQTMEGLGTPVALQASFTV